MKPEHLQLFSELSGDPRKVIAELKRLENLCRQKDIQEYTDLLDQVQELKKELDGCAKSHLEFEEEIERLRGE